MWSTHDLNVGVLPILRGGQGNETKELAVTTFVKLSRVDMDMMARAVVLESAVGLPPGTFSSSPTSTHAAFAELPTQYPNMNRDWVSKQDLGIHQAVVRGAKSVLKSEVGELTADEVAQNMAAGLSVAGDEKTSVYAWMGKRDGRKILNGKTDPGSRFVSDLFKGAKRRALDIWNKHRRQKALREEVAPSVLQTEDQVDSDIMIDRSPAEVIMHLVSSPAGDQFRNWVYRTIRNRATPIQVAILDQVLENPGITNAEIAKSPEIEAIKGEPISRQMVGKHRKIIDTKIVPYIAKEMRDNPQITGWIDRYLELAQLGYGGGSLRAAGLRKMAIKVAHRYLQR
jgi:hypothetical protein